MSTYKILFLGDIVGKPGRLAVELALPGLQEQYNPLFTIVNAENAAAGHGMTPDIGRKLFEQGVDGITLGNHAFNKSDISSFFDENPFICRPANMPPSTPGRGSFTIAKDGISLTVSNLCGRVFMDGYDDPFRVSDEIAKTAGKHWFVDFHAEATSEKVAFGWHLSGKASVVVGTHTHIQTADERILDGQTAFITDVGMCGPINGVIGMDRTLVLRRFRTSLPTRFEVAEGPIAVHGVLVEIERETGNATSIRRIRLET